MPWKNWPTRRRTPGSTERRALSLVETVIATSMVAVAILAVLALCPTSKAVSRQAEVRLAADNLAQALLEERRLLRLAQLQPRGSTPLPPVSGPGSVELAPFLEVRATGPGLRAREIRVTVRWTAFGREGSLTHATVLTPLHR